MGDSFLSFTSAIKYGALLILIDLTSNLSPPITMMSKVPSALVLVFLKTAIVPISAMAGRSSLVSEPLVIDTMPKRCSGSGRANKSAIRRR